ncbi:hypothetical protein AC1031_009983 [Aphanomyces cochlioides]|nr:hypothetical protein AC1031_009983 [Aphanomyces cochlioides]
MGFEPYMKQEELEACLALWIDQDAAANGLSIPPQLEGNPHVATLANEFVEAIQTVQTHIDQVTQCRGQIIVRAFDVVRAANAMGVKLYGYDDVLDESRLARLHADEQMPVVAEPPASKPLAPLHLADHDIVYTAPTELPDSDTSDSEGSSWEYDSSDSFGEGDFSECESSKSPAKAQNGKSTDNPYCIPRRAILRLFRDTIRSITMETRPISRKALSAFHNLAETLLRPLLATCVEKLAASYQEESSIVNTTPTINRRGKKRLSGDVFPPMAIASQKRKSPRLAKKNMRVHLDFTDDSSSILTPQQKTK